MLQYEYKSVYFVCRKPKFSFAISPSASENGIYENNIHSPVVDEEDDISHLSSDTDNHDIETN